MHLRKRHAGGVSGFSFRLCSGGERRCFFETGWAVADVELLERGLAGVRAAQGARWAQAGAGAQAAPEGLTLSPRLTSNLNFMFNLPGLTVFIYVFNRVYLYY